MTVYLTEVEVLMELVDGLKKAAGSAHALAHYQENPKWLVIRDTLEKLIETSQTLVVQKSMPRQDVLSELTLREQVARVDN